MRQIILDTETTGLEADRGHRIIEIGCVELANRRVTGRRFHRYLNPDRDIDEGALAVHGITRAQLEREPRFPEIADELLAFCEGAELVIHNAAFDLGFLDAELKRLPREFVPMATRCRVLDTLVLARELHPGQRNSLDALCKRYGVDNSQRELHGALLDAMILADVYLAMTGGQGALALGEGHGGDRASDSTENARPRARRGGALPVPRASDVELAAHESMLDRVAKSAGGSCLFRTL
ncbi:MAG: DNA polymerase III subunit epsilon [Steroidobacteraceae bacterium]|jgi:DNA polymerase-3 subunit epsilon|nr:DNA polymerase III subunit epsilon [Steroidobacteraceae bacterium]